MEHHHPLSLKWFVFIILTHSTYLTATNSLKIPRLSPFAEWETTTLHNNLVPNDDTEEDVKTFYYSQVLDHFNYRHESYKTFQQRYLINFKYWGGANSSAPILAYLGAESPIDDSPLSIGFLADNAHSFNALLVYIEHRYYGKSIPFGSREEAFKDANTLGYFNSAQALADYAEVLMHIKKTFNARKSPVIVVGGSYGGNGLICGCDVVVCMNFKTHLHCCHNCDLLAAWFRLKYPHLAIGALASSAPILYFDNMTPQNAYFSVVTRDFREASETCYETILKSWSEIDRVASLPKGLSILSQRFNTCHPLNQSLELKDYLIQTYAHAAQYNSPPRYPVSVVCGGIDGASFGSDILSKIYAGVVAYKGNTTCKVNGPTNPYGYETTQGWRWQTCSEMVIAIGIVGNNTMFQPNPYNFKSFAKDCKKSFGVSPRPHWVTTYYGGHNIKLVLQKFGSSIIFSNGLRDPYSSGGVLNNISDSLVAIYTVNGSHCLDILPAYPTDPDWLVLQRKKEVKIIKGWIMQYYVDLNTHKGAQKFQTK